MPNSSMFRTNSLSLPDPLFSDSITMLTTKSPYSKSSTYSKPSKPSKPFMPVKTKKCKTTTPKINTLIKKYMSELNKMKKTLNKLENQRSKTDQNIETLTSDISAREDVVKGLREAASKLVKINTTKKKSASKKSGSQDDALVSSFEKGVEAEDETGKGILGQVTKTLGDIGILPGYNKNDNKEAEVEEEEEEEEVEVEEEEPNQSEKSSGGKGTKQKGGSHIRRSLNRYLNRGGGCPTYRTRGGRKLTATRRRYGY